MSKTIRAVAYILAGTAIIAFHKTLVLSAGLIVGGVVIIYALEELLTCAFKRRLFKENGSLFEDVAQLVIGTLLILSSEDLVKVCVIWGVWSILRESREMAEAIKSIIYKKFGFLNAVESVVVIALSAIMILEPGEHHATFHMALLGVELILEIVFEIFERYAEKKREENEERTAQKTALEDKFSSEEKKSA